MRCDAQLAGDGACGAIIGGLESVPEPEGGAQLVEPPLKGDRSLVDDRNAVANLLDLRQQVARVEHRHPTLRKAPDQRTHVPDSGRVEPVGGLIEDKKPRIAEQCGCEPEALPHPHRIGADAVVCTTPQLHLIEDIVDSFAVGATVERAQQP